MSSTWGEGSSSPATCGLVQRPWGQIGARRALWMVRAAPAPAILAREVVSQVCGHALHVGVVHFLRTWAELVSNWGELGVIFAFLATLCVFSRASEMIFCYLKPNVFE